MTRPDRPGGLEAYRRVFSRSKGLSVPDPDPDPDPNPNPGPVPDSSGPELAGAMTKDPSPYSNGPLRTTTPTTNLPPTFPSPFNTRAEDAPRSPGDTAHLVPSTSSLEPPQVPGLVVSDYDSRGDWNLQYPYRRDQVDNAPPRTFDDIRRASTSQNRDIGDDQDQDQHLGINVPADDAYSEASSRFRAKRSQYATSRSWRKDRGGYGSDSDKEDKGGVQDAEDEAYDTDLDSLASQGGIRKPREHARKLWKWKSLVANRYEHMLLECIVNIGTFCCSPNLTSHLTL